MVPATSHDLSVVLTKGSIAKGMTTSIALSTGTDVPPAAPGTVNDGPEGAGVCAGVAAADDTPGLGVPAFDPPFTPLLWMLLLLLASSPGIVNDGVPALAAAATAAAAAFFLDD